MNTPQETLLPAFNGLVDLRQAYSCISSLIDDFRSPALKPYQHILHELSEDWEEGKEQCQSSR